MEFLLPVAVKLFPNMLPSTFETQSIKVLGRQGQRAPFIANVQVLTMAALFVIDVSDVRCFIFFVIH